jgi:hypothetical protein
LKKLVKTQWAFGLWAVIFIGVLIFGLWGPSIVVLPIRYKPPQFWHYWEFAALLSTCIFNVLFYILGFFMPPQMFKDLKSFAWAGLIPFLLLIAVLGLIGATISSLMELSCWLQLLFMVVVAVCFWVVDSVMARQSNKERVRQDFRASVKLNDTPALMAFSVLFIYSLIYRKNGYDQSFRAFIGGAIAFQMIVSNWVLALIFRKPGEWYNEEDH